VRVSVRECECECEVGTDPWGGPKQRKKNGRGDRNLKKNKKIQPKFFFFFGIGGNHGHHRPPPPYPSLV
jgi:hypothetical protein